MPPLLEEKVAIVTGASREIGAAMAEMLAAHGCTVLAAHFGEAERAAAVVERIRAAGGRVQAYDADLSSVAANQALIARAVEASGALIFWRRTLASRSAHHSSTQPRISGRRCST